MINFSLIIDLLPVLVPLIFLNLVISYEDFKKGVIKNKYIITLLLGGLIYQFFIGNLFTFSLLQIFLYGLGAGFLLWFLGIWPAGDAKLFASLLLYFPATFYKSNLIFNYSINIFVPIFLVIASVVLIKNRGMIKEALEYTLDPYRVFFLVVMLLGFVSFVMDFFKLIGLQGGYFLSLLVLFVAFEIFYWLISVKTELIFTLIAALRIIVDYKTVLTLTYLYDFLSLLALFLFLRFFILYLTYHFFSRKVKIENLEGGMGPAEGIIKRKGKYGKLSFLNISLISYMMQRKENFIHDLVFLTDKDVKTIKQLKEEEKLGFDTLRIDQKQHFASILFFGYLLTLLLNSNFIAQLKLFI